MKYWLPYLLLCAGCHSAALTPAEQATLRAASQPAGAAGYGRNYIGQRLADTVGLRVVVQGLDNRVYRRSADSLAYGLVPLTGGVLYAVTNGELNNVGFWALGTRNGNRLQACMEHLYGPLVLLKAGRCRGERGEVMVLLKHSGDSPAALLLDKRQGEYLED